MVKIESSINSSNQNLYGALAYLVGPVSGVLLLVIEKSNKFVRFHAMQSIFTFVAIFLVNVILGLVPILGWLVGFLISVPTVILWVFLMWKAYSGETYKLPYIGEMAEKQLGKM